jgi:hypothetical protein
MENLVVLTIRANKRRFIIVRKQPKIAWLELPADLREMLSLPSSYPEWDGMKR